MDVDLYLARRGLVEWGLAAPMPRQQMNVVSEAAGPRYAARYRLQTGGDLNDSFGFDPLPLTVRPAERSSLATSLKVEVVDVEGAAGGSAGTPGPVSEHRQGKLFVIKCEKKFLFFGLGRGILWGLLMTWCVDVENGVDRAASWGRFVASRRRWRLLE